MRLFLECKPDETLALALGIHRKVITHSHSKGRVARSLAIHSDVTGMVDEDFCQTEPKSLATYVEDSSLQDLKLRLNADRRNRLVVICPRFEPWLIKTAKVAAIQVERFGLSSNLRDLDADINHRLPNLERLLNELLAVRSPRLLHLEGLLHGRPPL